jgi:hypothetical protein
MINNRLNGGFSSNGKDSGEHALRRRRKAKKLAQERVARKVRTILRNGNIYIGGAGCAIGSRKMKLLDSQGTAKYTRHLAIDTDDSSRSGVPNGMPFRERDFCHVSLNRVSAITNHPDRHGPLVAQVGLDDPNSMVFHRKLSQGTAHAGQVRSYGFMGCISDLLNIRIAIKRMVDELTSEENMLKEQLREGVDIQIASKLQFNLYFSIAGGTGSSMALAVGAILRDLTKGQNVEITATMVMPEAFTDVLGDRPDQLKRVYANGTLFLMELEAARSGLLEREKVQIGVPNSDCCSIPPNVFNQIYVVGRTNAAGAKLGSLEAVFDTVATYAAGLIGTELNDRASAELYNEQSIMELTPDPLTRKTRNIGSVGAKCLSIDKSRMAKHLGARLLYNLLKEYQGKTADNSEESSRLQEASNHILGLVNKFHSSFCPTRLNITRELYANAISNPKGYLSNGSFLDRMENATRNWKEKTYPILQSKVLESVPQVTEEVFGKLSTMLEGLGEIQGALAQRHLGTALIERLTEVSGSLKSESEVDSAAAKRNADKLNESLAGLKGTLRGFLTTKASQDAVASMFADACITGTRSLIKHAVHGICLNIVNRLKDLLAEVERHTLGLQGSIARARELVEETRCGQSLTTASTAELNLGSDDLDDKLYRAHNPGPEAFAETLGHRWGISSAQARQLLATSAEHYKEALKIAKRIFSREIDNLSVVDILADLLTDPSTRKDAVTRLHHALETAQPLWVSDSGQLGILYSDMFLVGLPAAQNPNSKSIVEREIDAVGGSRKRADGQYPGIVQMVETGDKARIYITRRTTGALWHYFPEVAKGKEAVEAWHAMGGHSTSIFNKRIVAQFESLIPELDVDEGELAMAIGLAYGWIATRGSHLYDNLVYDPNDKRWVVRLSSAWSGIAFAQSSLRPDSGSVKSLVDSNRMVFQEKKDPEKTARIGQGFAEAFETVSNNGEIIEKIMEAFDLMRSVAGDLIVIQDLEAYIVALKTRSKATDSNYVQVQRMLERLGHLLARLKSENT